MRAGYFFSADLLPAFRAGQLKLGVAVWAAHVVFGHGSLAARAEELSAAGAGVFIPGEWLAALWAAPIHLQGAARCIRFQPAARAVSFRSRQGKLADRANARCTLGTVPGARIEGPAAAGAAHQAYILALHGNDVRHTHRRADGNLRHLPTAQAGGEILRQGHATGGAVAREQRLAARADLGPGGQLEATEGAVEIERQMAVEAAIIFLGDGLPAARA